MRHPFSRPISRATKTPPSFAKGEGWSGGPFADGKTYQTETLLDVDRYAATEFRAGYDTIVSKAVASTVLKVVAQVVAQKLAREQENALLGALLEIGTTLAAAATTQADTRMWRALPQSINIASMPWPVDDRLRITTSSGRGVADIKLPSAQFVLVTVKTVSPRARPTFNVAPFGRKDTLLSKTITPKAWSVANLDKKYGMLGIRQAVMQSREVPRLVHAAYIETGLSTLSDSENGSFVLPPYTELEDA